MRFSKGEVNHDANKGLSIATEFIRPLKEKYRDFSHADFYALTAICAIQVMNGPKIPYRPGRPDAQTGKDSVPEGRLPDAQQG